MIENIEIFGNNYFHPFKVINIKPVAFSIINSQNTISGSKNEGDHGIYIGRGNHCFIGSIDVIKEAGISNTADYEMQVYGMAYKPNRYYGPSGTFVNSHIFMQSFDTLSPGEKAFRLYEFTVCNAFLLEFNAADLSGESWFYNLIANGYMLQLDGAIEFNYTGDKNFELDYERSVMKRL